MCEFKPGDEVVCVDAKAVKRPTNLVEGQIYTVSAVVRPMSRHRVVVDETRWLIELAETEWDTGFPGLRGAYRPERFRKVQRRDLTAWLETSVGNTDKLDKRAPAKEGAA